jgi:3'-5' exoribonuclease
MKTYIKDLQVNDEVVSFFLLVDPPQVRQSKRGSDYWSLALRDKTGEIEARVWEVPPSLEAASLKKCVVKVKGTVSSWQDKLQLSVTQIRPVAEADAVDMGDFFEASERDPDEMWRDVIWHVDRVQRLCVKDLLMSMLSLRGKEFRIAPAAKSVHHAFVGGLMEHVADMLKIACWISDHYDLDYDLMVAGCIGHDWGKLQELSWGMGASYTRDGSLLGHISQGVMEISAAIDQIPGFPHDLKVAIMHLILSHHGLREYGSPTVPLMREAIALNLIDLMSSKMGICAKALKSGLDTEGKTEWVKQLDGSLFQLLEEHDEA